MHEWKKISYQSVSIQGKKMLLANALLDIFNTFRWNKNFSIFKKWLTGYETILVIGSTHGWRQEIAEGIRDKTKSYTMDNLKLHAQLNA